MPHLLDMELGKTADVVINKLCNVKLRESVLITIDGPEKFRVAEEIAKAAEAADAKLMVAWHEPTSQNTFWQRCRRAERRPEETDADNRRVRAATPNIIPVSGLADS